MKSDYPINQATRLAAIGVSLIHVENLVWDGDNRIIVCEAILPKLDLRPDVRQVIRWAYGYDGSDRSYEMESDGSSVVPDLFIGGLIKEPFGVGHDMLFILHHEGRADPSGHVWGWWEANNWYRRALQDFGLPARAWVRWTGLTLGSWVAWLRNNKEAK